MDSLDGLNQGGRLVQGVLKLSFEIDCQITEERGVKHEAVWLFVTIRSLRRAITEGTKHNSEYLGIVTVCGDDSMTPFNSLFSRGVVVHLGEIE